MMKKPVKLNKEQINLEQLEKICEKYIDFVDNDDEYHEDNDYTHYIFEKAMETIFGEGVWNFINNRQDD